jgi:TatA/E family protein of Tat protein translocase
MGPLGWQETVFIFLLALLIFGPKKLPELGKTIGKALTEFRRASSELKSTWDREMVNLERENESLKDVTNSYHNEIASSTYDSSYDSSYYDSGYNGESYDSTASNSSTVSASAPQGAESTAEATPEGTVTASTTEAAPTVEGAVAEPTVTAASEPAPASQPEAVKT